MTLLDFFINFIIINLEKKLTACESKDLDGFMLAEELQLFSSIIPAVIYRDPVKISLFISVNKRYSDIHNTHIALRILLTIPVTLARGERSFSKPKLFKPYMPSTRIQDRLTSLAVFKSFILTRGVCGRPTDRPCLSPKLLIDF